MALVRIAVASINDWTEIQVLSPSHLHFGFWRKPLSGPCVKTGVERLRITDHATITTIILIVKSLSLKGSVLDVSGAPHSAIS